MLNFKLLLSIFLLSFFIHSTSLAQPYASGSFHIKSTHKNDSDITVKYFYMGSGQNRKKEFVATLKDGQVWRDGIVMDKNKHIMDNFVLQWPGKTLKDLCIMQDSSCIANIHNFTGTLVSIDNAGHDNYYHWMFQILPRIEVLRQSGLDYDKLYFAGTLDKKFHKETLDALNVKESNILYGKKEDIYQADNLLVPSISAIPLLHGQYAFKGWIKDFLSKTFITNYNTPHDKRIYISRWDTSTRRVANEVELTHMLKESGFEVITLSNLSVKEQAQLFYDANIIIAQHGAGLTNLIFSRPNTKIIEINSETPFAGLCQATNLQHFAFNKIKVLRTSEDKQRLLEANIPENKLDSCYDIKIDIGALHKLLLEKILLPAN